MPRGVIADIAPLNMGTKELGHSKRKINKNAEEWLISRGITPEVILSSKINTNQGSSIAIPIFDKQGNHLFNKYRRDPDLDYQGKYVPKYKYDKGSSSALYNLQKGLRSPVFITEGEFDALRIESAGFCAVSSTGGSGTFDPEWAEYFKDLEVFIVYDRDEAGFKGSARVQSIIPWAKIITLPKFEGKDITDFLQTHSVSEFFAIEGKCFDIPIDTSSFQSEKKDIRKKTNEYKDAANKMLETKREYIKNRKDVTHIIWMLDYLNKKYEQYRDLLNQRKKVGFSEDGGDRIQRARSVPISNFINFDGRGYARCLWHNEKDASLFYNEPGAKHSNTVKCFGGCGIMEDTIGVVMKLYEKSFNDAIKFILNED